MRGSKGEWEEGARKRGREQGKERGREGGNKVGSEGGREIKGECAGVRGSGEGKEAGTHLEFCFTCSTSSSTTLCSVQMRSMAGERVSWR